MPTTDDVVQPDRARDRASDTSPPIYVWRCSTNHDHGWLPAARSLLSPEERAKTDRLVRATDRESAVLARGATRLILARHCRTDPRALRFGEGEQGKPYLVGEPSLHFNVAHSGEIVVVAVRREHAVGVDVEKIRGDVAYDDLARRFLSNRESHAIAQQPPDRRLTAFFDHWVHKEAYVKGHGVGVSYGLETFTVCAEARTAAPVDDPAASQVWATADIPVRPGYRAAVASVGLGWRVHVSDLFELL